MSVNVRPTMAGSLLKRRVHKRVTQHGNWTRPWLVAVAGAEQSPGGRDGAEHGEVVDRHDAAENAVSADTGRAAKAHRLRKPRIRVDAVEGGGALTDVEIIRIRAGAEANSAPSAADVHETGRFDHARRRLEQERVRDGEDRGVGANADGERHRGRDRHDRIAAQQPCRVHQVSSRVARPQERASVERHWRQLQVNPHIFTNTESVAWLRWPRRAGRQAHQPSAICSHRRH